MDLVFAKRGKEMRNRQNGFGGIQLLLVVAGIAAFSFANFQESQSQSGKIMAEKARVADALNFADESRRKIEHAFVINNALPRTSTEVSEMNPTMSAKPEFVREVEFQTDFSGETVMIMVYLNDGVVDDIIGGEQYLYIAGFKSGDNANSLQWQCGARNVDLSLLPEECRS